MKQRATAIVIAGVMLAAGLSVAPAATAGHGDCHKDFNIPDSKPGRLQSRTLLMGESEVGLEKVTASGGDEELHVLLDTDDILEWTVFIEDANNNCQTFSSGDCDIGGSYPNTIQTEDTEQTCTLDAPSSGSESYWVLFENVGSNSLQYRTWVS